MPVPKETAQEAVTTTANQTAQEAANQTAQQSPQLMSVLLSNPVLVTIGIFSLIALAIIAAIAFVAWSSKDEEEEFEKDSLESVVQPEFRKVVREKGKKNKSTVRRDLRKEGEIWKDVRFNENDNLVDHLRYLKKDEDSDFNMSLSISAPGDEELKRLRDAGVYDDTQIRRIKDSGVIPHRLMWIRPNGLIDKIFWLITDKGMGKDLFSRYRLIPEHQIVDNPGDNSISIDRNIQLRPFAGVEMPLYFESFSILHAVVTRRLYEASLEDQVNYSEKINFFDSKFSQRVQEIKAEAQAESDKYSNDVAGDVNSA